MIEEKDYLVGEVVYLMYQNRIVRGIITSKSTVKTRNLNVETVIDIKTILSSPSSVMTFIEDRVEDLYTISIIPNNKEDIDLTPIKGGFYGISLFDTKEELLSYLDEKCP